MGQRRHSMPRLVHSKPRAPTSVRQTRPDPQALAAAGVTANHSGPTVLWEYTRPLPSTLTVHLSINIHKILPVRNNLPDHTFTHIVVAPARQNASIFHVLARESASTGQSPGHRRLTTTGSNGRQTSLSLDSDSGVGATLGT